MLWYIVILGIFSSAGNSNIGKFTATIQDAKVDLNPHQVEAALFAFQSPWRAIEAVKES